MSHNINLAIVFFVLIILSISCTRNLRKNYSNSINNSRGEQILFFEKLPTRKYKIISTIDIEMKPSNKRYLINLLNRIVEINKFDALIYIKDDIYMKTFRHESLTIDCKGIKYID